MFPPLGALLASRSKSLRWFMMILFLSVLNLTQVFLIPFLLYLIGGLCLDSCLLITNPPIHSYTFTLP